MGDRAMVVNAACVNQIDGSPNIVGGGGVPIPIAV